MISCGAFSIFKRFSAREKTFHEMPVEENDNVLGAWEGEFNEVQQFNAFKSSIGSKKFNLGTIFQMKNHSIALEVSHFSSHECSEKSLDWRDF
jgi:hypothetical protein